MNQYLRQAALLWKTVRPEEDDFSWKMLLNVDFIKVWIYFWDSRAEKGEITYSTPQNRVKGIVEVSSSQEKNHVKCAQVIRRMMAYLPKDEDQVFWNNSMVVCHKLLNAARSVSRGTEAANRSATAHKTSLEQNKQWLSQSNFRTMIHEAMQIIRRVTGYQAKEGHIDLPVARRVQDALIVLLSLTAGGKCEITSGEC